MPVKLRQVNMKRALYWEERALTSILEFGRNQVNCVKSRLFSFFNLSRFSHKNIPLLIDHITIFSDLNIQHKKNPWQNARGFQFLSTHFTYESKRFPCSGTDGCSCIWLNMFLTFYLNNPPKHYDTRS
jgi:hypothetical protein